MRTPPGNNFLGGILHAARPAQAGSNVRSSCRQLQNRPLSAMPKVTSGPKWYAVRVGRIPGIYTCWDHAQRQVSGYPGNIFKSFQTEQQAKEYLAAPSAAAGPIMIKTGPALPSLAEFRSETQANLPGLRNAHAIDGGTSSEPAPALNAEQNKVLQKVLAGQSVFFTGSAGTGKSVLLRAIIAAFRQRERDAYAMLFAAHGSEQAADPKRWRLGITASTGMAGVNIGGSTLHSWAGIGLGDDPIGAAVAKIRAKKLALRRWLETKTLLVDEISMISGEMLDYLDQIARAVRGDGNPFGGLQVIFSGDFFQLPPVGQRGADVSFAFQAQCWHQLISPNNTHELTRVYRQTDDTFVKLLERMRQGEVGPVETEILHKLSRPLVFEDRIEPVGLYPKRDQVDQVNDLRLAQLRRPLRTFRAIDVPGSNSNGYQITRMEASKKLDSQTKWPSSLKICRGAMVMLVKNLSADKLVNGSTGIVTGFTTTERAARMGISTPCSPYATIPASSGPDSTLYPIVEFTASKSGPHHGTRKFLIPTMGVDIMNAQQSPEATRYQVPLVLAWALTIHKSQGQTLERVKVDLGGIFEKGQSYVALSRAVSMDGLELHNFRPEAVVAHPAVLQWAKLRKADRDMETEWENAML